MKTFRPLVCWLLTAAALFAADAIEFRGVTIADGIPQLSLMDKASDTARWVEVGKSFVGFTVKAYDQASETATLVKDGREIRVRMNSAKILESPVAMTAASASKSSLTTARTIFNNLRQIAGAADQYYLEHGGNTTTLTQLVGPTKYIKQLNAEAGEDYSSLQLMSGKDVLSVTTSSGETITYDISGKGSSFYPVRAGETLSVIAQKAGVPLQKIVELNPSTDPTQLSVGQLLRVK